MHLDSGLPWATSENVLVYMQIDLILLEPFVHRTVLLIFQILLSLLVSLVCFNLSSCLVHSWSFCDCQLYLSFYHRKENTKPNTQADFDFY